MSWFEHAGWRLQFEDEGEGPPVLLIHGLLMDHTMFDPQVAALRDRYRVITPDCRGHGQSDHQSGEYTQWDLMEDHTALLDQLAIERAVWGGVSMGGFQSLRAALAHPDRVAGLILIDTQAGPEDENRAPMYEAFAAVVAAEGWNDEILTVAAATLFGPAADEEVKRHWMGRWRKQPTDGAVDTMHAVSRREDLTDRLVEVTAPAIVVHGQDDLAIEMALAEVLASGLPNLVEFTTVPGAGHSSTVERPGPVTDAVDRFLSKLGTW